MRPARNMAGGSPAEVRVELEERTMQLMSVQRNYDSISRLMAVKNSEIEQVGRERGPACGHGGQTCARCEAWALGSSLSALSSLCLQHSAALPLCLDPHARAVHGQGQLLLGLRTATSSVFRSADALHRPGRARALGHLVCTPTRTCTRACSPHAPRKPCIPALCIPAPCIPATLHPRASTCTPPSLHPLDAHAPRKRSAHLPASRA